MQDNTAQDEQTVEQPDPALTSEPTEQEIQVEPVESIEAVEASGPAIDIPEEVKPVTEPVVEPGQETETADASEVPVAEPEPAPAPAAPAEPATPGARKKILLVEDDMALAAVYRSRLELEDFDIREVNNGEQALQAAKEYAPDLILLDAMMPKISGFDVLDILRHTPETTNIRVIMLTALSQPKDKEKAEELGVDDYLVKSQVVIGDVVDRVKHHLGLN